MTTHLCTAAVVKERIENSNQNRLVIFLQNCDQGTNVEQSDILETISDDPSISEVIFSGSDPFDQSEACARLAIEIKHNNSQLKIWVYTQYCYENILNNKNYVWRVLLDVTDVLVDEVDTAQRYIDVSKSNLEKHIVLLR